MKHILIFFVLVGFTGTCFAQYAENETGFPQEVLSAEKKTDFIQKLSVIFDLKSQQHAIIPDENLLITFLKVTDDSSTSDTKILSPLKQFKFGILIDKITCNTGLQLIIKHDNSPACVKFESADILIKRGFGYEIDKTPINLSGKISASQADIKVYDNILGKKPFAIYPGMHDIVLFTSNYFWNNTSYYNNWDKIDWKLLQSKLNHIAKITPIRPIVLDIEGTDNEESGKSHWSVDQRMIDVDFTAEQYYEYTQHWIQIIDFVKNNYPGDVGVYGLAPIRDFFTPIENIPSDLESWHFANSALSNVVEHVDFVVPSLYTFYDEPKYGGNTIDARSKWVTYAQKNILEAQQYGKPIYVYLSGYFHPSNYLLEEKPISKEFMMLQYETVIDENIKQIVIWGKYSNTTELDPLDEPWYRALSEMGLLIIS